MNKPTFVKSPLTQAVSIALLTIGISACGSSSSSGGGGGGGGGGAAIDFNLNGGQGTHGVSWSRGGSGGSVDLYNGFGGSIEIRTSGTANASFTPISIDGLGNTGGNPLNVTADTTVSAVTLYPVHADAQTQATGTSYIHSNGNILRIVAAGDVTNEAADTAVTGGEYYAPATGTNNLFIADGLATFPAAGIPYFRGTSSTLYLTTGDGAADTVASGVEVSAGRTLTLELNNGNQASVSVDNDFINRGTVTTLDSSPTQRGRLSINANYYFADGDINTNGTTAGQDGGSVSINVNALYNRGDINTSGADNSTGDGGSAGYIDVSANDGAVNTGNLDLDGGDATGSGGDEGAGGNSDYVIFYSNATVANSGNVSAAGGDGVLGGGDGGEFDLDAGNGGIFNSGNVTAPGGAGGGSGGSVNLYSNYGGAALSSGNLNVSGGDGNAANTDGGSGGDVDISLTSYFTSIGTELGIVVSGDMDLSGGDSASGVNGSGGNGGDFNANEGGFGNSASGPFIPGAENRPRVALLGYSNIGIKGGDGGEGGDGGDVNAATDSIGYDDLGRTMPGGNVTNEAAVDGRGGSTTISSGTDTDYYGGAGGSVFLEAENGYTGFSDNQLVDNSGALDLSAGDGYGYSDNNSGGWIGLYGDSGVTNTASLNVSGSDDNINTNGTSGWGSSGGEVDMESNVYVDNTGQVVANGGNGEYSAGSGGWIGLYGDNSAINTASLTARGGNADGGITDSTGGDGGCIAVNADSGLTNHSGSTNYAAGTGDSSGTTGGSYIGGFPSANWLSSCDN